MTVEKMAKMGGPCLNFADLRELKGTRKEFVPEMTGGQITLLGCRGVWTTVT